MPRLDARNGFALPITILINGNINDARDILERIEIKLMKQARHYLRASVHQRHAEEEHV